MVRNTLSDLTNILFERIEALNDDDLSGDALKQEISRCNAVSKLSTNVIAAGNLMLDASRFADEKLDANTSVPALLGSNGGQG